MLDVAEPAVTCPALCTTHVARAWVEAAAPTVAPLWPLATAIATNGFGGFEDLPFEQAITRGGALLGSTGYLPNATSRRYYRQGRITDVDLDDALAQRIPSGLPTSLVLGAHTLSATELSRTCLLSGPGERPANPPAAALARAARSRLPADPRGPAQAATEAVERDLASIGDTRTLADLCALLGAGDLPAKIDERVGTWCAAFLDEGQASWAMPGRERGLYACWRALAPHDRSLRLLGIRGAAAAIGALPDSPDEALAGLLDRLGIPEERRPGYLARHLAQQPGWAGFIRWRGGAPEYRYQAAYPTNLVEYLAIRLFYEAMLVDGFARRTCVVAGSLGDLAGYLRAHPQEHYARALLVQRAIRLHPDEPSPEVRPRKPAEWATLAAALHAQGSGERGDIATWLGDLAGSLGLTAAELAALPDGTIEALLAIHDVVGPTRQGPIWLEALEHHHWAELVGRLRSNRAASPPSPAGRPLAQAVFCIDVRSEGLRRHLEAQGHYQTFGFAGFFGVPAHFQPFASGDDAQLCPVLLTPTHRIAEVPVAGSERATRRVLSWRERRGTARNILNGLKGDLLTPFALVEATGWAFALPFAGKTLAPRGYAGLRASLAERIAPPVPTVPSVGPTEGRGTSLGISVEEQADFVEAALRAIGLTDGFAPLVLLCGHGGAAENNPYAAALDCGACGNRGGTSARIAASILNSPAVRAVLASRGIAIPADTLFLAGEHNTTIDRVVLLDRGTLPSSRHGGAAEALATHLDAAGAALAAERCRRLPGAPRTASRHHVETRGADWAQLQPEWGLAGNAAFICGPRAMTAGLDLGCRTFLHSYEYRQDPDGAVLEGILTAPLVVAEWINMQYYCSTVDNARLGSGNKLLHNVVGRFGVLQGRRGDLRIGLPWQSVMDGERPYHEPMRLLAVIEASAARLDALVARNATLRQLFGNRWVTLLVREPGTGQLLRHDPGYGWLQKAGDTPAHP